MMLDLLKNMRSSQIFSVCGLPEVKVHPVGVHDYMPDFIVRLRTSPAVHLILETKRFAAERWVAAVNADSAYGQWQYGLAKRPTEVPPGPCHYATKTRNKPKWDIQHDINALQ